MKAPQLTPQEVRTLNDAEDISLLRHNAAFKRVMAVIDLICDESQRRIDTNDDPRIDAQLAMERRIYARFRTFINNFIDQVQAGRQNTLREIFRDMGLPPELAERNLDMSLSFLTETPYGRTEPAPTEPESESAAALDPTGTSY